MKETRPRIRRASSAEAEATARIYVESSNAAFAAYQPPMELTEDLIRRWAKDMVRPDQRWWFAELDGIAVGLAGIGPSRDPTTSGVGELDTIAVLAPHRRRGIGRTLMAVANDGLDLAGYHRAVLWTWADYPVADAFYTTAGWSRTELRRDEGRQVCYARPNGRASGLVVDGGAPPELPPLG